jgi:DNA-binding GntR family transcriptional regulator
MAARLAASEATSEQLESLKALVDEEAGLVKLDDLPRSRAVSRRLHAAIVEAGGNILLHRIYLQVLNAFPDWMLYEHLYRRPELLKESLRSEHREHAMIVEALERHDPGAAAQCALDHIVNRGRELEQYLGISHSALAGREAGMRQLLRAAENETRS